MALNSGAADAAALDELVVEVRYKAPSGRWSSGSGFLVGGALVLTAAHNVGDDGDVEVRAKGVKGTERIDRPAHVLKRRRDEAPDLALLEIEDPWVLAPHCRYGVVDRREAALIERCWAVGYPRFMEEGQAARWRPGVQVDGVIPTGDHIGRDVLTLRIGNTPALTKEPDSEWSGMSGAVVFARDVAGDVVVGVIAEHRFREGMNSLRVVPISAIDALDDAGAWWRHLGADRRDLVTLPMDPLQHRGLALWTFRDFEAGQAAVDDTSAIEPIERGEPVDLALLRSGRLPNLQRDFRRLGERFDEWLTSPQRKRGSSMVRVLWMEDDAGPHRGRGRLACLSRAGDSGRAVYDAGSDLHLVVEALRSAFRPSFSLPPLISVDVARDESAQPWHAMRGVIDGARSHHTRRDPASQTDPYPSLVVAGTAEQAQAAWEALEARIEITRVDMLGRDRPRPYSFEGTTGMVSARLPREHVYNRGLPMTTPELLGREGDLEKLRDAWVSPSIRVISIVAYGGTGKSSLVNTWLHEMRDHDYRGAQRAFAWSFYSQGTKDNLVSADVFVNEALRWLGEDQAVLLAPSERGELLASLVKQHDFLLVLDGLEPLQYPLSAPHVGGTFTDNSLAALLERLATPGQPEPGRPAGPDWRGLCVVTTRVPLTNLRPFEQNLPDRPATVLQLDLRNLDDQAGAALLARCSGSRADFRELQEAVREVDGHALAITLMGNYLRDRHGGNLRGRYDLEKLVVDVREGGHARRVMASYVRWLEKEERFAELAILLLIGLFDRPALPEALAPLVADASLRSFMADLDRVGGDVWNRCVEALRTMGLLNGETPDQPGTVDAHPLVREHFRDELLRKEDGRPWLEGNRTLFGYYCDSVVEQPEESVGMGRLYAAVGHGCAAELHQEVFEDVLLRRVWRDRRTSFSTRRLGMTGSDLVALSNYFRHRWDELLDRGLSPRARVLILTNAGVRLRQLGRLVDARTCFGAVVREIDDASATPEEFEDAAYAEAQFCELLVIAGKLTADTPGADSAMANALSAVEHADRGNAAYFQMHARSSLAEVHFMLGDLDQAGAFFDEAMEIDRLHHPEPPFLYSQSLFRRGYYLIETGRAAQVLGEADTIPGWGTNGKDSSLLSQAIRSLILGAAHRSLVEEGRTDPEFLNDASDILEKSINAFRTAGYADYLVRGLIERAHFYRARHETGDYRLAIQDLDRAQLEAEQGEMDLLLADVLLQRAACYLAFWPAMSDGQREAVRGALSGALWGAAGLVTSIGYGRRRNAVAELWGLVAAYAVPVSDSEAGS